MKKLLSIIAACLLSLQAAFALGDPQFGIDLGAGVVANIGSSNDLLAAKYSLADYALKPNFGWRLGFEASWGFTSIGNPGPVQPGPRWVLQAAFSTRGYHWKEGDIKESLHTFDFQLAPFLFAWHFNFRDGRIGLRPHVGPYVSFDFAGMTKTEYKGNDNTISIWDKDTKVENKDGKEVYPHQSFDVGVQEGVDLYLAQEHLYLGLMVQEGFMQMVKKSCRPDNIYAGTHFGFLFRVGYRF